MDEDTKIWNKKVNDLTVKDTLVLTVATPIVMMAGVMIAGAVIGVGGSIADKFRSRKNTKIELVK